MILDRFVAGKNLQSLIIHVPDIGR